MSATVLDDPVLRRFRAELDTIYGDRLERVILFGSRARGDAGPESDYDVAVFLRDVSDRWREIGRLADLRIRFLESAGVFFDAKPYLAGALSERTPIMHEVRRDGIDL